MRLKNHQSRALTEGEKALARLMFGNALMLEPIRLKTARWVLRGYAVAPNGNIYFHPADFIADFSHESVQKQAWLIHELTHVWQHQQGIAVFWRALVNRRYAYQLTGSKPFLAFGVEQQAQMVEDYFLAKIQGKDCAKWADCVPFCRA